LLHQVLGVLNQRAQWIGNPVLKRPEVNGMTFRILIPAHMPVISGDGGGCLVSPLEDWHFDRRSISTFWLLRFWPSAVTFWGLNI
jgi:hypothetical protein